MGGITRIDRKAARLYRRNHRKLVYINWLTLIAFCTNEIGMLFRSLSPILLIVVPLNRWDKTPNHEVLLRLSLPWALGSFALALFFNTTTAVCHRLKKDLEEN